MSQASTDVIVITALPVEYKAVAEHLCEVKEVVHPEGTIYEVGKFSSENQDWQVAMVQVGMGNSNAAFETDRAIAFFKQPAYVFFVGVAGGLKDVTLGDVVVATKVYGFEYGKDEEKFKTRPEFGESAYALIQRAKTVSRQANWVKRIQNVQSQILNTQPTAFLGAIAAGEKVVASMNSQSYQLLKEYFSDALAVEMEGFGFFRAIHANHKVQALLVRGISALIDNKSEADATGSQVEASRNAAAFAFEVLAKLKNLNLFGQIYSNIYFNSTEKKIRDNILDQTGIIEDKTQEFVGRQFVFDAIDKFIENNPRGYFVVRGDPGIGKSALAAQLVKAKSCVYHFNIRAEGTGKASTFLTNE
jgi:nucleoside phosphorylase